MDTKNFPERRKEKRFKLDDAVFAVIHSSTTEMCRIIDISMGGLAIMNLKGESFNTLNELDIFKPDFSFYMEGIKAETVFNTESDDKTRSGQVSRRSGIQFLDLSPAQFYQLESFIQNLQQHDAGSSDAPKRA